MSGTDFLKKSVKIAAAVGALAMLLCEIAPGPLSQYSTQDTSLLLQILSPFYGAIFSVAAILTFGGFYGIILFSLFGLISFLGGLVMLFDNLVSGAVGIILGSILLIGAKNFTQVLLTRLREFFPAQYPRRVVILATFPLISTFYFWHLVKANGA